MPWVSEYNGLVNTCKEQRLGVSFFRGPPNGVLAFGILLKPQKKGASSNKSRKHAILGFPRIESSAARKPDLPALYPCTLHRTAPLCGYFHVVLLDQSFGLWVGHPPYSAQPQPTTNRKQAELGSGRVLRGVWKTSPL